MLDDDKKAGFSAQKTIVTNANAVVKLIRQEKGIGWPSDAAMTVPNLSSCLMLFEFENIVQFKGLTMTPAQKAELVLREQAEEVIRQAEIEKAKIVQEERSLKAQQQFKALEKQVLLILTICVNTSHMSLFISEKKPRKEAKRKAGLRQQMVGQRRQMGLRQPRRGSRK